MGCILAIEADQQRRRLLTRLVRERVKAELTIAESVRAALALLAEQTPDVILTPTLLSPQDSAALTAHVNQLHASYVQMLTIPALDMLAEPPNNEARGVGRGLFRRRPTTLGLQYDPQLVAAQIVHGLERARTLRAEHEARLLEPPPIGQPEPEVLALTIRAAATAAAAEIVASGSATQSRSRSSADDRRCARRNTRGDVPWLSAVKLPWGADLNLINISRTGLLVESGSKLTPGITTELHLTGPSTNLLVKARFVRSEVACVNNLGVRYFAAAAFEKELNLAERQREVGKRCTQSQALADLLANVLTESDDQPEPALIRFARGVRRLVRARDVLIRRAPIAPADGSESIYFDLHAPGRPRAVLQVMFDRDRALTQSEFRMLRAASSLANALLELDRPSVESPAARDKAMSEVA
jgi:CheY-like chemotaxis protein